MAKLFYTTICCPICYVTSECAAQVWDDRFGYPGLFSAYHCPSCNHRHIVQTNEKIDPLRLYSDWYPRRGFVLDDWKPNQTRDGFVGWLTGEGSAAFSWIPPRVRILDIGAGWGESLGYHAARGCDVWGVDADENLRRVAVAKGFSVHIGNFAAVDFPTGNFDWITMDQVVEHLPNPSGALTDVMNLLKPGGHLVVTTPNGHSMLARLLRRRWVHIHAPYHMHLFSRTSLRMAALAAGFIIERHTTITNSAWYHFQWMHLIGLRPPGQRSPYWCRSVPFRRHEQVLRVLAAGANRFLALNHLFARILDAFGQGDNQVLILRKPTIAQ